MRTEALQRVHDARYGDGLSVTSRTRSGIIFDATQDLWAYRDGTTAVSINFGLLPSVSDKLKSSIKRVMAHRVEMSAASGVRTYFSSFKQFLTAAAEGVDVLTEIQGTHYLNYSARSGSRQTGHVKSMLEVWRDLALPGLAADIGESLAAVKLKGPAKGIAVATMDPHEGPLTDLELEAVQQALNQAYASGAVGASAYVLAWLFFATGARPIQLAAMKVKDVHQRTVDGALDYSIDVPRAKQGQGPRAQLTNRPLSKFIGDLVVRYASTVRESFVGVVDDATEAPLFPDTRAGKVGGPGFEHHRTQDALGSELTTLFAKLAVKSERLGTAMNITPIRLRRTFGTRAAQEGHGVLVIAELLDHSDTQNAGVYVETRPDIARRIDKAVALELAPIAQAFAGKLVTGEATSSRAGDPSSRIRDLRISAEPLASCGSHSFCAQSAPVACYTCSSFEPWLDGPHEAVLDSLLARRERQLLSADQRFATVLDRTIVAVAQVVQLCGQQRLLQGGKK